MAVERLRARALDILVLEAANAVEFGLAQPIQQQREVRLRLAGKTDDEGRAHGEIRTHLTPVRNAPRGLLLMRGAAHGFQHGRARVLKRDVQIGQDLALCHQRNDVVDMRIRVDVVQPHPGTLSATQFAERGREVEEAGGQRRTFPGAGRVFDVEPVSAGVLRDHQQLLDAGFDQPLGLGHHVIGRPARQAPA